MYGNLAISWYPSHSSIFQESNEIRTRLCCLMIIWVLHNKTTTETWFCYCWQFLYYHAYVSNNYDKGRNQLEKACCRLNLALLEYLILSPFSMYYLSLCVALVHNVYAKWRYGVHLQIKFITVCLTSQLTFCWYWKWFYLGHVIYVSDIILCSYNSPNPSKPERMIWFFSQKSYGGANVL